MRRKQNLNVRQDVLTPPAALSAAEALEQQVRAHPVVQEAMGLRWVSLVPALSPLPGPEQVREPNARRESNRSCAFLHQCKKEYVWLLHHTGYPLFERGLAAITTSSRKHDPAKLIEADLEDAASFIERNSIRAPYSTFVTISLMNSDSARPAYSSLRSLGKENYYSPGGPFLRQKSICEARSRTGRVETIVPWAGAQRARWFVRSKIRWLAPPSSSRDVSVALAAVL